LIGLLGFAGIWNRLSSQRIRAGQKGTNDGQSPGRRVSGAQPPDGSLHGKTTPADSQQYG